MGEKLFVLLQNDHYVLDREIKDTGLEEYKRAQFSDKQKAHTQFWNRYARQLFATFKCLIANPHYRIASDFFWDH